MSSQRGYGAGDIGDSRSGGGVPGGSYGGGSGSRGGGRGGGGDGRDRSPIRQSGSRLDDRSPGAAYGAGPSYASGSGGDPRFGGAGGGGGGGGGDGWRAPRQFDSGDYRPPPGYNSGPSRSYGGPAAGGGAHGGGAWARDVSPPHQFGGEGVGGPGPGSSRGVPAYGGSGFGGSGGGSGGRANPPPRQLGGGNVGGPASGSGFRLSYDDRWGGGGGTSGGRDGGTGGAAAGARAASGGSEVRYGGFQGRGLAHGYPSDSLVLPAAPYADELASLAAQADEPGQPVKRKQLGMTGKHVALVTNCYELREDEAQTSWFQYMISFTLEPSPSQPAPRPLPDLSKRTRRKIWQQIGSLRENQPLRFNGATIAFDGRDSCVANKELPGEGIFKCSSLAAPDGRPGTFSVSFSKSLEIPLRDFRAYRDGRPDFDIGNASSALAAIHIAVKHVPAADFPVSKTSVFVTEEGAKQISSGNVGKDSRKLDGGVEIVRGWYQAVKPCRAGLQLVLDGTSSVFLCPGKHSVLHFVLQRLGKSKQDPAKLDARYISANDADQINRVLRHVDVLVRRGADSPLKFTLRHDCGLVPARPMDFRFEAQGQVENVETYLKSYYEITLTYPNAPMIRTRKGALYPIELVEFREGNFWPRRLTESQQEKASTFQVMPPAERFSKIVAAREQVVGEVSGKHLTAFGFSISPNPTIVRGRVIEPPTIAYSPGADKSGDLAPQGAQWKLVKNKGEFAKKFIVGAEISSIAMVVENEAHVQLLVSFIKPLFDTLAGLGVNIDRNVLKALSPRLVYIRRFGETVEETVHRALAHGKAEFRGVNPSLVFCVFDGTSPEYDLFKLAALRARVASQVIQLGKLKKVKDLQLQINLSLKINVKLGGINHVLNVKTAGLLTSVKPMIWGGDISHEAGKPSVSAVVASMGNGCGAYEEAVSVQGLQEPEQPDGRPKKREVIEEMRAMVVFLLRRRVIAMGKLPPESHIFFRDGVSEGEFTQVLDAEVEAFMLACKELKEDKNIESIVGASALADYSPKLTFVPGIKTNHMRAFNVHKGRVENVEPGTIIDDGIAHVQFDDWFAAAHKSGIGTTRLVRYCLLADSSRPRLSEEALQHLAHVLCYVNQRVNKACSLPAPVSYADILANQMRKFVIPRDEGSSADGIDFGTPQSRRKDLEDAKKLLEETEPHRFAFRSPGGGKPSCLWFL
ncbi:hypothetical protein JCM8097_006685 [Rhodosporidiobolus ruineniae]